MFNRFKFNHGVFLNKKKPYILKTKALYIRNVNN